MSKDKLNISTADIAALKAPDVLHSYCRAALGAGKQVGRLTFYRCPWGAHTRPKLEVTEREGIGVAMCRACNTGGTVFDVAAGVLELDVKRDFPAVVKAVADAVGYPLRDFTEAPPKKGRRTRKESRSCCPAVVTKAAPVPPVDEPLDYLPQDEEEKAIEAMKRAEDFPEKLREHADRLGIPFEELEFRTHVDSLKYGGIGLDEYGRLLYIYAHRPAADKPMRVFAVKRRSLPGESPRFIMRGSPALPWGMDNAADAELVIITEGESDSMAVNAAFSTFLEWGARNAPDNYPKEELQAAVIAKPSAGIFKESWALKLKGKNVILIVDNDEAGRKGAEKTAGILRAAGVRRVFSWTPPDGIKDARAALDAARPWLLADDIMENRKEVIL